MKTKIKEILTLPRLMSLGALLFLIVLSASTEFAFGQAVTQGYGTDSSLQRGMLVQIDEDDTTKVKPVSRDTAEAVYGVVVNANDAPATLSTDSQKVFVATAGKYEVLVTDQNGDIENGDYIVLSALNGIGMKVNDEQPTVVARALESFTESDEQIGTAQVGDKQVKIGRVLADINIAGNPYKKADISNVPDFLQQLAEEVAQKPVNAARIYVAVIIILVSAAASASLLFTGVRHGLISLGRNPLSRKTIIRGMLQVILVAMLIFITGVFGVYLLLKF